MATMDADDQVQALARQHQASLVRAMALVCGDLAEAEDAVQDAFTALWQTLSRGEIVAAPSAWLATASMNRLRSSWRRSARHARYLKGLRSIQLEEPRWAEAVAVRAALGRLPQRQREAAVLYYLLDFSVEDTAVTMRTSPGMVKNALSRARQAMAIAFADMDGSNDD
jgi:RNA polymerase sigma-70 factor, ECF subfamily